MSELLDRLASNGESLRLKPYEEMKNIMKSAGFSRLVDSYFIAEHTVAEAAAKVLGDTKVVPTADEFFGKVMLRTLDTDLLRYNWFLGMDVRMVNKIRCIIYGATRTEGLKIEFAAYNAESLLLILQDGNMLYVLSVVRDFGLFVRLSPDDIISKKILTCLFCPSYINADRVLVAVGGNSVIPLIGMTVDFDEFQVFLENYEEAFSLMQLPGCIDTLLEFIPRCDEADRFRMRGDNFELLVRNTICGTSMYLATGDFLLTVRAEAYSSAVKVFTGYLIDRYEKRRVV